MPQVKLTDNAKQLITFLKCAQEEIETDNTLNDMSKKKVYELCAVFKENFDHLLLSPKAMSMMSNNFDFCLAWLNLLDGINRDVALVQLTGYALGEGNHKFLERMEWHGFKTCRLPSHILKGIEQSALANPRGSISKYLLSLKNPREYNIEE